MKKFLFTVLTIILCVSLLSSCNGVKENNNSQLQSEQDKTTQISSDENSNSQSSIESITSQTNKGNIKIAKECKHKWKRIENLNEYIAVEKCSKCDVTREYTDSENIPDVDAESNFKIIRIDAMYYITPKNVSSCDLAKAIVYCLSNLEETGEIVPKISDNSFDDFYSKLPHILSELVTQGTRWIDCGSAGIFRLDPEMKEICKVEKHFGEGKALKMTETLRELLVCAEAYYPNDYWSGVCENGKATLRQVYKNDSAVESVAIKSMYVDSGSSFKNNNKITLTVKANETKTSCASIFSYHSADFFGSKDSKEIKLIKGKETTIEFTFTYAYNVDITIDNTKIGLYLKS